MDNTEKGFRKTLSERTKQVAAHKTTLKKGMEVALAVMMVRVQAQRHASE